MDLLKCRVRDRYECFRCHSTLNVAPDFANSGSRCSQIVHRKCLCKNVIHFSTFTCSVIPAATCIDTSKRPTNRNHAQPVVLNIRCLPFAVFPFLVRRLPRLGGLFEIFTSEERTKLFLCFLRKDATGWDGPRNAAYVSISLPLSRFMRCFGILKKAQPCIPSRGSCVKSQLEDDRIHTRPAAWG